MTVEVAPARRAVIDLGADATILDAARHLASVDSPEIVLIVPPGAPLTRNAAFLDVLRRRAGNRRVVLVSSEARARSLAAAVHMKAFSSIAALDRHELDATEQLSPVRRAALATVRSAPRRGMSPVRGLAVFMSLVTALAIFLAVVGPATTVVIAATPSPLGPFEYDLRAGPNGGDIRAQTMFNDKLTAKTTGTATGTHNIETKAVGQEKFTNLTTNDLLIRLGTIVQTNDNPAIRFRTTEDKTLPRSTLIPRVTFGEVLINIEAIDVGTRSNVGADKITRGPSVEYMVTNPAPTTGGEQKTNPIVQQSDYDQAVAQSDRDVLIAAQKQTATWAQNPPSGTAVYGVFPKKIAVVTQASEVVGKELTNEAPTFEITVSLSATAYAVAKDEPKLTALDKLRHEVFPGMELDEKSATIDPVIGASVAEDGVHWRVRASGKQLPKPNYSQMTAALAGRSFDDVTGVVQRLGFEKKSVTPWPSWWPRLPVLESRITIQLESSSPSPP